LAFSQLNCSCIFLFFKQWAIYDDEEVGVETWEYIWPWNDEHRHRPNQTSTEFCMFSWDMRTVCNFSQPIAASSAWVHELWIDPQASPPSYSHTELQLSQFHHQSESIKIIKGTR
jgi:hypothetical protein